MRSNSWRYAAPGTALVLAFLIAGCQGKTGSASNGIETGSVARDTNPPSPTETPNRGVTPSALTDGNILALLDEANKADSAAGAAARPKATNHEVKAFAMLMMGEHHGLRLAGERLAKKIDITPEPPAPDPLLGPAADEMQALESTPKGPEFDRVYIEKEVTAHQAVKELLDKAHGAAQNAELKQLIETAQPIIQRHLERAQTLQAKLRQTV